MRKKIIGALVLSLILYFLSISYYEKLLVTFGDENISRKLDSNDKGDVLRYTGEMRDFKGNLLTDEVISETPKFNLNALSAALIDGESGRVLFEKSGYKEVAMASTTKIMTCIIALEYGNLNDVVTVSKYASTMPDVQLNIVAGEQYILNDLLYSLMLESHNDVSVAIAEHVGGSVEGFAKLMNAKAKELGCEHTNFVTPNGLDAEGHYTTAVELSKIAAYAIQNPEFIKITNTASWVIKEQKKGRTHNVTNKDRFLYLYDGAIGVKTGFTNNAGYCFVGAVKKDNKTLITAVLGSGWPPNKNYKWKDTISLMDYGRDKFVKNQIFYKDKVFDPIPVYEGMDNKVSLYYNGDMSLLMKEDEMVRIVYELPQYLVAPVTADTVIGNAKYYIGNELYEEVPIYTAGDIEKIDLEYCLKKIFDLWVK